jgi:hypothetical protein
MDTIVEISSFHEERFLSFLDDINTHKTQGEMEEYIDLVDRLGDYDFNSSMEYEWLSDGEREHLREFFAGHTAANAGLNAPYYLLHDLFRVAVARARRRPYTIEVYEEGVVIKCIHGMRKLCKHRA